MNNAADVRAKVQAAWPGATVHERGRKHIIHKHPEQERYTVTAFISAIHKNDLETEIDTAWQLSSGAWQYEMLLADYKAYARNVLNAGDTVRYEHSLTEYVVFQPLALNWVNQDDSRQQIAIPGAITAQVNDDTLYWQNAYGTGRHFIWQTQTERLQKRIIIDALSNLPNPEPWLTGTISLEIEFILKYGGVTVWVDGVQWNEKDRVLTGNYIEFKDAGGQVLWYFDKPLAWDSGNSTITGEITLRKQAASFYVTVRIPRTWVQIATFPIEIDPSTSPQVGTSNDDGRWAGDPIYSPTASSGQFGRQNDYDDNTWVRVAVTGPANGDTIESGTPGTDGTYVDFTARLGDSTTGMSCRVVAVKGDSPGYPSSYADAESPAGGRTSAYTSWIFDTAWSSSSHYYTPDIATVIQEIIDQGTWDSGDYMVVYVEDYASSNGTFRRPYQYDSSTSLCPVLTVEYTSGGTTHTAAATLAGVGGVSLLASTIFGGIATVTGVGTLVSQAAMTLGGSVIVTGVGTLTAAATVSAGERILPTRLSRTKQIPIHHLRL